jgi:hypothetical protein
LIATDAFEETPIVPIPDNINFDVVAIDTNSFLTIPQNPGY